MFNQIKWLETEDKGAGIVIQWVNPPVAMLASYNACIPNGYRLDVGVPPGLQIPVNEPRKNRRWPNTRAPWDIWREFQTSGNGLCCHLGSKPVDGRSLSPSLFFSFFVTRPIKQINL